MENLINHFRVQLEGLKATGANKIDAPKAKMNKKMISDNDVMKAWRLEQKQQFFSEECKEIFIHIKWHTVHEFWVELGAQLADENYQNIQFYPSNTGKADDKAFIDAIASVTHNNEDVNHGILFEVEAGRKAYISGQGVLSWGLLEPKMWTDIENPILKNINFSEFQSENTFRLIDKWKMESLVVPGIIRAINDAKKKNFRGFYEG